MKCKMSFRRNLVVLLMHGLRSDTLGDYSTWPLACPHFLKLAAVGVRLVVTSCSPMDPAGMTSLYTGLHARQHGIGYQDNMTDSPVVDAQLTDGWPRRLVDEGYHLGGVGRVGAIAPWLQKSVLVDDVSRLESPDCAYLKHVAKQGMTKAIMDQRRQRLRYGPFEPDRLLLEPDDDIDGFIGAQAASMIESMPAGDPWATVVSFSGPGNDLPPPTLYDGLIDPTKLMKDFAPVDLSQVNELVELDYPRTLLQRLDAYQIGRIRADYLGRVSLIDHAVSRVIRAVSHRPDASRTWIVLASDRGCLLGEHGLVGHRSFLSPVMETPAIIAAPMGGRAPGIAPGNLSAHGLGDEPQYHEGLVSHVDVAATIAALGGCDLPSHTAGRSLLPLLTGNDTEPRVSQNACLSEYGQRLMLETRRHKIIFNTQTQTPIGFYDLLNDSGEKTNLVNTPAGRNLLDTMRWRVGDVLMPLRHVV